MPNVGCGLAPQRGAQARQLPQIRGNPHQPPACQIAGGWQDVRVLFHQIPHPYVPAILVTLRIPLRRLCRLHHDARGTYLTSGDLPYSIALLR